MDTLKLRELGRRLWILFGWLAFGGSVDFPDRTRIMLNPTGLKQLVSRLRPEGEVEYVPFPFEILVDDFLFLVQQLPEDQLAQYATANAALVKQLQDDLDWFAGFAKMEAGRDAASRENV